MKMMTAAGQNKYKEGEVVRAVIDPNRKLIITRYLDRIYYCQLEQNPERKNLAYFERELEACQ
jgi:hypothetical protein